MEPKEIGKYVEAIIRKVNEQPGHYEFDFSALELMIYSISREFREEFYPDEDDVLGIFCELIRYGKVNAEKDRLWPIDYPVE